METGDIVQVVVSVVVAAGSIGSAVVVAVVGWFMKRAVESADRKLDELPVIRRELAGLTTELAVVKVQQQHHNERQGEFCDRLERIEEKWRPT